MQSVMSHAFSMVPEADIERSSFDRSHGYKTTFDAGLLIPFFVDEALPGDTFNLRMHAFARLATPIKPIMDNMFFDTFFFAVPYRLVWANWKRFNGEQPLGPSDTTAFTIPIITPPTGGFLAESIADYMGVPVGVEGVEISSLPLRAYNLIWNDWFRDQNLQPAAYQVVTDGPDVISNYPLRRRGKRHDYFTSCLPWPQKGTEVTVPLGTKAPVRGIGIGSPYTFGSSNVTVHESGQSPNTSTFANAAPFNGTNPAWYGNYDPAANTYPDIYADLAEATAATINSLREAFQLQRLFERDARGGTRYTEIIRSHFGVVSPDARLQRPEYLGGGSEAININPVAQTSPTGTYAETVQGNMAAFGTFSVNGHGFVKSFTEHCIVIGLGMVRADLTYQQGLNRMWSRRTRFDHYWPALAHLGEQAVLNKEIYAQGSAGGTADDGVFGYQERFAEYRYKPSLITGQFRSNFATSLDLWHLAQDFSAAPALNDAFIQENPPVDRIIAVPAEPHFLLDCYFKYICARPMPTYSVPGYIDHF